MLKLGTEVKSSSRDILDCRGAAALEAAIALPAFFLIIFGLISAGQLLATYVFTADALRLAGREAMVHGSDCRNSALTSINSRLQQSPFRPEISGLNFSLVERNGIPGAQFELTGRLPCAICDFVFGQALNFSSNAFVPLEYSDSCQS